jgi:type I restriction enzyme S subunit
MSRRLEGKTPKAPEARSNIPKVNRDELSEQTIPLPPLPLQQKFAALVERMECLRAEQREALRQAEHVFASLTPPRLQRLTTP